MNPSRFLSHPKGERTKGWEIEGIVYTDKEKVRHLAMMAIEKNETILIEAVDIELN